MSKFCICIFHKYQHLPCVTQAIHLHSNCFLLDNANNTYITILLHGISLTLAYLRAVTIRGIWNTGHPSASLTLGYNSRVFGPFGRGPCQKLDWHPWHFPWNKKHRVSIKVTDGEVEYLVGPHTEKSVNGHENCRLLLRHNICPTPMCGIVKWCKR